MIVRLVLYFQFIIFVFPLSVFCLTVSLPLKDILPVDNIVLSGKSVDAEQYGFKLSIPERWEVHSAKLIFDYNNSAALIKGKSHLIISLEKIPLAQISLNPRSPSGTTTVDIPGNLLKSGYHQLGFSAIQYSSQGGCEDPLAPELWTIVKLKEAKIEFNYTIKPVPLGISAISEFLFDPKNPSGPPVNFIFEKLETDIMKSVSLCATGVALRYNYRPVKFLSHRTIKPGMDTILIGSDAFVRKTLKNTNLFKEYQTINGPTLSINELPSQSISGIKITNKDSKYAFIIVTGRNNKEILTAAKCLSVLSLPLPDKQSIVVKDIKYPTIEPYIRKKGLAPGKIYTFASLGFSTTTFKGMVPNPKGFSFWIPSDSHLTPNKQAKLSMDIAYGAAMRKDSVLNIELNNKFVSSISCEDPLGGTFRKYKVRLFMSSLKSGYNKINFIPQLTTFSADKCSLIQTGNLRLTIFDSSTFSLPVVDQWVEMPHLGAFMGDGFPFSRHLDLSESIILIPDRSRSSFLTAVNLLALASQKTGYPPTGAKWSVKIPDSVDKDIILVSNISNIPDIFTEAAPLNIKTPGPLKFPHLNRSRGYVDTNKKGFWSRLLSKKTRVKDITIKDSSLVVVSVDPVFTTGRAALVEFQSPFNNNRTVMMLTTHSDSEMKITAKALWDPGVQASCMGDTVLINLRNKKYKTLSLKLGPSYYVGEISTTIPFVDYYANTHPLWYVFTVLIICLMLSLTIYFLLKKRKSARFKDAEVD